MDIESGIDACSPKALTAIGCFGVAARTLTSDADFKFSYRQKDFAWTW